MGIRVERQQIFNYSDVYKNISFSNGENSFSFLGQLNEWENVEITSRIFYKKLEALLYGEEVRAKMYDSFIVNMLTYRNQKDDTILDLVKKHDYSIESLHSFFMEMFDFVYFSVKKQLPYTKHLSLISNAVSELLENTFKYSSRKYCITAVLDKNSDYPLNIYIENTYDNDDIGKINENVKALRLGIEEVNSYSTPEEAYFEIMKNRLENSVDENGEDVKTSRLGLAKISADTKSRISLEENSEHFGEKGITIKVSIPLELYSREYFNEIIETSLKQHSQLPQG
ncbi:MAG: hypothetical protein J1G30_07480 [Spirochaetales bacterium]|nr:hypothetical protein [Spirochaetales bacterium]